MGCQQKKDGLIKRHLANIVDQNICSACIELRQQLRREDIVKVVQKTDCKTYRHFVRKDDDWV